MNTEKTTLADLAPGARILVTAGASSLAVAKAADDSARVAEVREVVPAGRRRRVVTDLGVIEAGGTSRVLRVVDEPEPADTAPEPAAVDPGPLDPAPEPRAAVARVTTDKAGRLTADSVVSVGDVSAPVPLRVDHPAGHVAPVRLGAALRSLGYAVAGRWSAVESGVSECRVVEVDEEAP